jgi:hypothetical protein
VDHHGLDEKGDVFMEISAIMNIYELAMNRTIRQKADAQTKRDKTSPQDSVRQAQQAQMGNKGSVDIYPGSVQTTITQDSYPVRLSKAVQPEIYGPKEAIAQKTGITEEAWAKTVATWSIVNTVS